MIEPERIRSLNVASPPLESSCVLYWMRAAQRIDANHALFYAAAQAKEHGLPLAVMFIVDTARYPGGAQLSWMLDGLRQSAHALRDCGAYFSILKGDEFEALTKAASKAALVVCDSDPSRGARTVRARLAARLALPVIEVDGESVIPTAIASPKQEWSARTFRLKVSGAIGLYLDAPSYGERQLRSLLARSTGTASCPPAPRPMDLPPSEDGLFDAFGPPPSSFPRSGPAEAKAKLDSFIGERLHAYERGRNDPNAHACSGLSPYLRFGQLSPLSAARAARAQPGPAAAAFLEQLVIRRELCRNFAWYRPDDYDSWEGLPDWCRRSLEAHGTDRRPYLYAREQFEAAATHDPYWNAAQRELLITGSIHGYMRMYWGKMILSWSATPREAFDTAVYLNDRYALDGQSPNGWAGVAWCFGLHDRPWPERPVFGTVRAMSAYGLKRKFDADGYVRAWLGRSGI